MLELVEFFLDTVSQYLNENLVYYYYFALFSRFSHLDPPCKNDRIRKKL